jgi:hypothetical protein
MLSPFLPTTIEASLAPRFDSVARHPRPVPQARRWPRLRAWAASGRLTPPTQTRGASLP